MNTYLSPASFTVITLAASSSWQKGCWSSFSVARLYQVDRVCSSSLTLIPRLTLRVNSRDWFWLTFTSDSRQEIKGPLTRVLPDIIPAIQDRLANDDRIALTSDDWNTLQKVNRLFTVLDNAKDPAVVQLFRSALAETNLRDKLRDVKF